MKTNLALLDWVVLAIYAVTVIIIGVAAGKKEKNTDDYFLAGRKMPWWAVMCSIYATSLSALTFIGVPGAAYAGDFNYIQLGIGDFFGRILIAFVLLTAYYKGKVTTVYELLGERFGPHSHNAGTIFFILTRLLASGVRLAGCAIALSVVFNIPINLAIAMIALTALAYTLVGGIKAVIWTDMMQFILFMSAAGIAIFTITMALPNGWSDFIDVGQAHQKFKIFHISFISGTKDYWFNFSNPDSLMAGFLFGCFTTFAALGTDQDMVQRMLTCEKVKESQKALLWTAVMNFPITLLFLSVGAGLFVYYNIFPNAEVAGFVAAKKTDFIFPHFIKTVLGPGLRGILIAGLLAAAMSSLDSALNALAASAYIDIFKRYIKKNTSDQDAVKISRYFVIGFAVVLAVIAIFFSKTESILWLGFRIAGYTYGAMLGVFLLAVFTKKRGNDLSNIIIMFSSIAVVIFFTAESIGPFNILRTSLLQIFKIKSIAWPWAIIIGTLWTFGVGAIFRTSKKV